MIKYLSLFFGLLLALSLLFNLEPVQEKVLNPWNRVLASASFGVLQTLDAEVRLSDNVLSHGRSGFSVAVENDCNGLEVTVLLLCAVLTFPSSWTAKARGLLLGFLTIQGLNLFRILTLFYLGQWNETIFSWTHQYLWPVLIIVATLGVFVAWTRRLGPPSGPADPKAA